MRKILLAIESYADLVQLESLLKKLGFDTAGVHNAYSIPEKMVSFGPDVVVMTGRGSKLNGVEASQKIKKRKGFPKIILLFPPTYQPTATDMRANMDLVSEIPVDPVRFLQQLCRLLGLDVATFMEKLAKIQGPDGESQLDSPLLRTERSARYDEIASQVALPGPGGLDRSKTLAFIKEQKAKSGSEDPESDEARRAFVKALFSKN